MTCNKKSIWMSSFVVRELPWQLNPKTRQRQTANKFLHRADWLRADSLGRCFSYSQHINKDNPLLSSSSAVPWYLTESAVVCFLIKKKNSITLSRLAILVWDVLIGRSVMQIRSFSSSGQFCWRPLVTEKISFQQIYFIYYSGYV